MRSQIERIREKVRSGELQRGQIVFVGDRTRRQLFNELSAMSRYSDEPNYDWFDGEIAVCGVVVRTAA